MTYDTAGQMLTQTDWSNSNTTTYDYTDNYFDDGGNNTSPSTHSGVSTATDAYVKKITLPNSLYSTFGYYFGTGQKALATDPNGETTHFNFYDSLNRPTSIISPNSYNSSCCGWKYWVYPSSSETQVDTGTGITSTSLSISCTAGAGDCRHDEALLDGEGRPSSQILVSDPDGQTTVGTTYDVNGRVYTVSNPHRSSSLPTDGTETYLYDGLDRKKQTTRADGSVTHTYYGALVSSYSGRSSQICSGYGVGYPILTEDEAGNLRQTWTDGFGRLIEVDEPDPTSGSLTSGSPVGTCYGYDLNNNLTSVAQGIQTRSFSYDMISRLTQANNPESGTINYVYDQDTNCPSPYSFPGQLVSKTNANGIRTCMRYDSLNRLTQKNYSDSGVTPTVNYYYDQSSYNGLTISNGKGRRTGMSDGSGATAWSYDEVGNVTEETRTIGSAAKNLIYVYYLDSGTKSIEYPSTRTITYAPGGAERPLSAIDSGSSINYATSAGYAPQGALGSLTNGSGIHFTEIDNSRLQPCWEYATTGTALSWNSTTVCTSTATAGSILDLKYGYNLGTSDNGNVLSIANNRDSTRSQAFIYDSLNRVFTAAASTYATSPLNCWGEQFTTDRWGNMYGIGAITGTSAYAGCTQENLSITVDTSNNQISTSGFTYDSSGDLTSDGSITLHYDGENRICSVGGSNCTTGTTYTYDGDGQRVKKSSGTLYWYDTGNNPIAETDGSGTTTNEYVFLQGKRIARRDSSANVYYYFADSLGTSRVVTNASGTILDDSDFYPYGGERVITSSSGNHYKFTGKERDSESGLDNFGARYDSSQYGRFMSPDPANIKADVEDFSDPQGWNGYAYVRNNPLNLTDPDGQSYQVCVPDDQNQGQQKCTTVSDAQFSDLQRNPGSGISLRNGDVYGTDTNGNQTKVGSYVQTDVDLPPGVGDMLHQAGTMADAGVKAAMIATAPEYLVAAGGAAAVELAGQSSLSVFEGAEVAVKDHALRHLASDALKSQAKAAIQQAINSGQIRYISGGTFIGRVLVQGQEYVFTGAFQNGVAQVGRITEQIRDSLGRFLQ